MIQKKGGTRNFMTHYKTVQKINKNYFVCVAGDMNARVGNKPLNFVLGTNGESRINQKEDN
jgi:hypothetical protein